MTQQIGRLRKIGIGKETSKGTAVAPAFWLPVTAVDINPVVATKPKEGAIGRIEDAYDTVIVNKSAQPSIEGYVGDKAIGLLLLASLGADSPSLKGGEASVYEHTMTVKNDNDHPALTISFKDGIYEKSLPYAMLNKLELEAKMGDLLRYKADFLSKFEASASLSPTYSDENVFIPKHITIKIASTVAGLSGATALPLNSLKLSIEKNAETIFGFGSNEPTAIYNRELSISGDVEAIQADSSWRDLFIGNTAKAMSISIVGDTGIGSASYPSIVFTFNSVKFLTYKENAGVKDLIKEVVGFKMLYSLTDTKAVQAVVTNQTASY